MMMMIMMSESQAQAAEDELATLRNKNAALRRQLQRRTGAATKRSTWKPHSLHPIPLDTPPLLEPKDILFVRDSVLQWLGVHSWVLRLGKAERKMLTKQELTIREERYQEFCDNYTASSLHLLHHDIYMALKRLLGKSLMVSHLFHQVTTETSNCASARYEDFSSEILILSFLCLCIYSMSFLTVPIFLFWPHVRFWF